MRSIAATILLVLACPVVLAAAVVPAVRESRARRRAIEEGPRTETPVWSAEFRVAARDMITEADLPDSDRAGSLTEMAAPRAWTVPACSSRSTAPTSTPAPPKTSSPRPPPSSTGS